MFKKIFAAFLQLFQGKQTPPPAQEQVDDTAPKHRKKRRPRKKTAQPNAEANKPVVDNWQLSEFEVAEDPEKTRFHDLDLPLPVMHAIFDLGFEYCSPIQAAALPHTLKGNDLVGKAQTGTGKTAAFLLTLLDKFFKNPLAEPRKSASPRALILAPTRELVIQIADDAKLLAKHSNIRIVSVFGGMDYQKQQKLLDNQTVDIIVATPGRLLDFQRHKTVNLKEVEVLVIDEADRMLDMGFIPDVRQIVFSTPHKDKRQTLFFSATFNFDVENLSEQWTRNATKIEIESEQVTAKNIEQHLYIVTTEQKYTVLYNLITQKNLKRVIVFANRRDQTRRLVDKLKAHDINCALLSGEVNQNTRVRTLENFRSGKIRVLVATDVAGRGLHVDGISHVVNYTLPEDPEDYVHRIGRTGRAGEKGTSVSFACEEDAFQVPDLQAFVGDDLVCTQPDESLLAELPPMKKRAKKPPHKQGQQHQGQRHRKPRRD